MAETTRAMSARTLHRADLGWALLRSALGVLAKAQLAPSVQPSNQARRHYVHAGLAPGAADLSVAQSSLHPLACDSLGICVRWDPMRMAT